MHSISRGKVDIRAKITDEVKPGILSSTFHFRDMMLNNITSSISDSEAMCPEYKVVACTIRKVKGSIKLKKRMMRLPDNFCLTGYIKNMKRGDPIRLIKRPKTHITPLKKGP